MEASNSSVSRSRIDGAACFTRQTLYRIVRGIVRLPALTLDIPLAHFSPRIPAAERQSIIETLIPGDILLTSDKVFPIWQMAASFIGSPRFSHAAVYEGNFQVIEATTFHPSGQGVARTAVDEFLSGRKTICIVRPTYASEYRKELLLSFLERQLGKPYDYSFCLEDTDTMYCAKLVAQALETAGFTIGTKRFFNRDLYLPDAFIGTTGLMVVYGAPGGGLPRPANHLPWVFILSVILTGGLINPLSLPVFCLLWIVAGWLQHLKKL